MIHRLFHLLAIDDFKENYSLLVFDVSKQHERLKNSPINI